MKRVINVSVSGEKKTTWERIREPLGWTALLGALATLVTTISLFVITPKSHMHGRDGRKFVLYEHLFRSDEIKAEYKSVLEENISKKLVDMARAKKDSIASVERARNDSIKSAMAKKKMKPRAQQFQQRQPVRIPQKH